MRATEFEFRHRIWFVLAIYAIGVLGPGFSSRMTAVRIANLISAGRWAGGSREWHWVLQCLLAAGALVVGLGTSMRTWGGAYLRSSIVHDKTLHSDRLVADGPYRFVRNPLYFGNILLTLGLGMMLTPQGWIWLVAAMTVFVVRLIGLEESKLRAAHGESFEAYSRAVPRLWPSLRPRVETGSAQPAWADGFLGEFWLWAFFSAMIAFAISLDIRLFDWIVGAGFVIGFGVRRWLRSRSPVSLDPPRRPEAG